MAPSTRGHGRQPRAPGGRPGLQADADEDEDGEADDRDGAAGHRSSARQPIASHRRLSATRLGNHRMAGPVSVLKVGWASLSPRRNVPSSHRLKVTNSVPHTKRGAQADAGRHGARGGGREPPDADDEQTAHGDQRGGDEGVVAREPDGEGEHDGHAPPQGRRDRRGAGELGVVGLHRDGGLGDSPPPPSGDSTPCMIALLAVPARTHRSVTSRKGSKSHVSSIDPPYTGRA